MSDSTFVTIFDITNDGYRYLWFPASGLILIAIGTVLPSLFKIGLFPAYRKQMYLGWFSRLFLSCAIIWTVVAFVVSGGEYLLGREELKSKNVQVVEGHVENFIPLLPHHNEESFDVDGIPFHYSDYIIRLGYNQTVSHGGLVRSGTYVRIWYVGNDILRLQVLNNQAFNAGKGGDVLMKEK